MTANRWWVRLAARWLARIDGVSGQLRLAMLGLTGISTMSLGLQSYGLGEFAAPIILILLLNGLAFAWAYSEGGVWNQMSRDRQDMSANFAGPKTRINTELTARAIISAQKDRPLTESERDAVQEELDVAFDEYRDGIELDPVEYR